MRAIEIDVSLSYKTQARSNGESTQGVLFPYVITYVLFNHYTVYIEMFVVTMGKKIMKIMKIDEIDGKS